MSEITHQKARLLIQALADQMSVQSEEISALDTHLIHCDECRTYTNELSSLEISVRDVFHT